MRNLNKPLNILAVLCALGGSLASMGLPSVALAASNQSAVNAITGIELENLPDGKLILKFNLKNPASSPSAFALTNPARVALDFADTQNSSGKASHAFNQSFLRTVTLVQAGNRTRAIVNLNNNVSYDTKTEGNQLIVTLQSVNNTAAQITSSTPTSSARAGAQEVQNIDFRRGINGEGRVIIDLSDSNTGVDVRVQGGKIVVDVLQNSLPSSLRKRFDVTDFATPVNKIDAFENNGNTRVEITPSGNWEYSAYQTNNRYIVEVKKQDLESAKANATNDKINKKAAYKGEKLSMNFQDVPVRTVLQVIAEFTKKNIVTTDSVTGNLTLRLQDVPWDQALDLILQTRGLDKRENGNVIMVAPKDEFTAKEKAELESRKALVELEPLRSETFQLKYMQASDFKKFLEDSTKDATNNIERRAFLSPRGSAIMADRSNMLFVNDIQSKLDEIRYLIEQIDVPSRQVMIEARIVEADDDFSRDLGVKLGFTRGNKGFSFAGNLGQATTIAGGGDYDSSMVNVNLPVAAAGGIGALIGNSLSSGLLGLELSALEADGRGKILSNPRVLTSNLIEASIEQGTEVPYQTISNAGTKTEFKKAVLQLKVLPQITPDGNLIMKVLITKDSPRIIGTNSTGNVIAVDTKQVNTEVMVENGGTIVIGGIYTESESDSVTKVPLLGDIPVVGNLFRTTSRSNAKKELLIFITPKILDDKLTLR